MAMFFIFVLPALLAAGVELTQSYERGPISLGTAAQLSWNVSFTTREISFGLKVSDSALSNPGDAWVGIGVGESTSGGMLGADIFTAEFASDILDNCTVMDRHVPFVAYPLDTKPGAYPVEDSCQDDASWTIVSCIRDLPNGVVILEVKRPFDAVTGQDRTIGPGKQPMMYAYGGSAFQYHGVDRGGSLVELYTADNTLPTESELPLPNDTVQNFTGLASNYTVPTGTTYACTSSVIPLPAGKKRYVVAIEPLLKVVKGRNHVHHFVVHSCPNTAVTRAFFKTRKCPEKQTENPKAGCSIIYGWAVGGSRITLPGDVGFLLDETNNMIVTETHYDNPKGEEAVDNSGIKIFLSGNRSIEAGVMLLGDFAVSMRNETVKNNFNYTSTCPSNCTAKWSVPYINVFASGLHMHTTGKQIWTNKYNSDGSYNETMNSIEFWSNNHQMGKTFNPPKRVYRGDTLSTTCIFDTSKRPNTKFGQETTDEMCLEFVWFYPAQRFQKDSSSTFNCGGFYMSDINRTLSVCGDALNQQINPSFDDTIGLPETFGGPSEACALAAPPKNITRASVCFPGSATVRTRKRGLIAMKDLVINDEVSVGNGMYSTVYMFTHKIARRDFNFVQLTTGTHENIRLTAGHYLYSNGRLTRADSVKVGDTLVGEDGTLKTVTDISVVVDTGLYNPQTLHGDIVVDGIVASTYTHAVAPKMAHALLAPLRSVGSWLGMSVNILEKDNNDLGFARKWMATFGKH